MLDNETVETETSTNVGDEQEQSLDLDGSDAIFESLGIDKEKYGIKEEEPGEEFSEEEAPPVEENSYLEKINAMGLVHNENPFKVETPEQLKSLIQQGFDYTSKTQKLSDERKTWETERSQAEAEINTAIQELNEANAKYETQLRELQQWQHTFESLKQSAPDVFEEVQNAYNNTARQFQNPILEQQIKAMNQRLAEAEKSYKAKEHQAIADEFEREKGKLSATEKSLEALGIKLDWGKIKEEWKNTGLPVNKVVGSLYFEDIAKSQASKTKVESVAAKVAVKPTGAAVRSRPGKMVKEVKNTGDYLSMAREMYNNLK